MGMIGLKNDTVFTHVDEAGDAFTVIRKKGDRVYYETQECAGWREHLVWTEGKVGGQVVRFFAVQHQLKFPLLTVSSELPPKGSKVLLDGRTEAEFCGVEEVDGVRMLKAFSHRCYGVLYRQSVQLLEAAPKPKGPSKAEMAREIAHRDKTSKKPEVQARRRAQKG